MSDVTRFGLIVLAGSVAVTLAVLSNRISARTRVPAPAIFLLAAAAVTDLWPALGRLPIQTVKQVVTVALVVILFDGGMTMGWRRFRSVAGPVAWIGVVGTFATAGGIALAAHGLFDMDWRTALLVGTALAPTDPAVVFSVLGARRVAGRTGAILEGESGANDPVGIALMVALVEAAGASGADAAGRVAVTFAVQMAVGAAVGVAGGLTLLVFMRRVPLPSEGLYPLRVLAGAVTVYGAATVAGGSGFLAVFTAGILIGDRPAPYRREIDNFYAALASLAEIVAFVVLGQSVQLRTLPDQDAWLVGLVLALLLAVVIRPVVVGLMLVPVRLTVGERLFVAWAGLKGAVPILLGTFVLTGNVPDAVRLYDVIFVVVAFSVIVQGGLLPAVAARCRVRMQVVEPRPWTVDVRLGQEPDRLHRVVVVPAATADGVQIRDLHLGETAWIIMVVRSGQVLPARGGTRLRAGDEILLLADRPTEVTSVFTAARRPAG